MLAHGIKQTFMPPNARPISTVNPLHYGNRFAAFFSGEDKRRTRRGAVLRRGFVVASGIRPGETSGARAAIGSASVSPGGEGDALLKSGDEEAGAKR